MSHEVQTRERVDCRNRTFEAIECVIVEIETPELESEVGVSLCGSRIRTWQQDSGASKFKVLSCGQPLFLHQSRSLLKYSRSDGINNWDVDLMIDRPLISSRQVDFYLKNILPLPSLRIS